MNRRRSRFYRALMWVLPADFRDDFGRDLEQAYHDLLAEAETPAERSKVRLDAAADLVWQATIEWSERTRRAFRRVRREGMGMDGWIQDLKFGVRTLLKRPAFSVAAIVTLGLGIGATVSMFSVVDRVLLQPLPYPDSEQLVVLWATELATGERGQSVDHPDVRTLQAEVPDLALAGHSSTRPTLTGFGDPVVVFGSRVTDGLITLMGLTPALGRDLRRDDDVDGGPRVVVVSHDFWTGRLGGDKDVIGRTITLSDEEWEIVGVAPRGFDYPGGAELWMPRRHGEGCQHGCRIMAAVGRLAPGSDIESVTPRLDAAAARMAEEFPDSHTEAGFALESMLDHEVSDVRTALWALLAAVGTVLLIACANVANLMLVRSTARRPEVVLRATLGASRLRIMRQLLTESLLLAAAAGAVGLALAYWGTEVLTSMAPESLPRLDAAPLNGRMLGVTTLLVGVVSALFGVFPALQMSRGAAKPSGGATRVAGSREGERSRSLLLVGEIALSLMLLLGTGLLVRTLAEIRAVDLGFETEGIERFRVSLPDARYDSIATGLSILRMEEDFASIPGVAAAGWAFGVPLAAGNMNVSFSLSDRPEVPPSEKPVIAVRPATPGFLQATGTPLLRGRWIADDDRYGTQSVAVINQAAVDAFFPDSDPIGVQIDADVSWAFAGTPPSTIVGVVGDVIQRSPTETPEPAMYLANTQFGANTGYFSLRLQPGVATAIPEARAAIAAMDPSLAIWDVARMEDVVVEARAATFFYATLLTVFSVVALVLAAVGLYGVVAYSVTQRTREIGIRIALGAATDDVTSMVVRQGVRPAVLGIVLGLAGSWFAARLITSLLYGVSPTDPLTIAGVSITLLLVALAATSLPARRAARVAPASALRAD